MVNVEEHDIFGDGVNVAARLEALAEPGGVFVSNTVYEHVRDRLLFEANQALQKAVTVSPASFEIYVRARPAWFRAEDHAHMLEGLRKAGWHE